MFTRQEIIELKDRVAKAGVVSLNPTWKRTYLRLLDDLDHLDAMIARSTDIENNSRTR